ncbi:MAG: cold-shock protein [Alphaproteobacteria bacterium]|nr:MAG: cold-shock protein [Alphaproteobacteria bacterium]
MESNSSANIQLDLDSEGQEENPVAIIDAAASHFDEVNGTIKWFDSVKGYGFISPEDDKGDILVHFSILKDIGRRMLPEGTSVKCLSADRPKGRQAVKILEFDLTTAVGTDVEFTPLEMLTIDVDESEFVEATVKWFNRVRGYGFVNRGDGGQDVFIHMELLRKYGVDHLVPGQTVVVAVDDGERGLVVKAIKV